MAKPVAVLGGGNGGHMMAADLSDRGYTVHFCEHPRFAERFRTTLERQAVTVEGIGPQGTIPVSRVSTDIGEALDGAEWVHVAMPANGHQLFFEEMVPHLRAGQKVVVWAGDFGALKLHAMLQGAGVADVTCIEASTLPYGVRSVSPGHVSLLLTPERILVASLPRGGLNGALSELQAMFPVVQADQNVITAAMNNPNPLVHPPGSLLNTGRIEYSKGDFYMYGEGITEAVTRVIKAMYDESRAVCRAFGWDMAHYTDEQFGPPTSIMGEEFVAPNREETDDVIGAILGPTSLKDRYITEDLPFGLVPRSELGRIVGVPTPVIDGIVSIGSHVCEEDFWCTGRRLGELGLEGLDEAGIKKAVEN